MPDTGVYKYYIATIITLDTTPGTSNPQQDEKVFYVEFTTNMIIGIAAGLICLVCCALTIVILVVVGIRIQAKKQKKNKTVSVNSSFQTPGVREKLPSPVYEEIQESYFKEINMRENEAYSHSVKQEQTLYIIP